MATKITKKQETAAKASIAKASAEAKPVSAKVSTDTIKKEEPKAAAAATMAAKPKASPKTTAPKKVTAKKEIKVKAVVEYLDKQVEEKDMITSVKKAWTKSGKKIGDIKTMELYIKPEEGAVYYVINGVDTGSVAF